MNRLFFASGVTLLLVACSSGPNEVKSSSYDQSCSVDADCVLVAELSVDDDGHCSMGCGGEGAVSTRAESAYRSDLDANAKACGSMPGLDCAPSKAVAACAQGKCVVGAN